MGVVPALHERDTLAQKATRPVVRCIKPPLANGRLEQQEDQTWRTPPRRARAPGLPPTSRTARWKNRLCRLRPRRTPKGGLMNTFPDHAAASDRPSRAASKNTAAPTVAFAAGQEHGSRSIAPPNTLRTRAKSGSGVYQCTTRRGCCGRTRAMGPQGHAHLTGNHLHRSHPALPATRRCCPRLLCWPRTGPLPHPAACEPGVRSASPKALLDEAAKRRLRLLQGWCRHYVIACPTAKREEERRQENQSQLLSLGSPSAAPREATLGPAGRSRHGTHNACTSHACVRACACACARVSERECARACAHVCTASTHSLTNTSHAARLGMLGIQQEYCLPACVADIGALLGPEQPIDDVQPHLHTSTHKHTRTQQQGSDPAKEKQRGNGAQAGGRPPPHTCVVPSMSSSKSS